MDYRLQSRQIDLYIVVVHLKKKKSFTSYLCVFNCYLEVNCVLVSFQFVLGNFLAHLVNLVDLIGRFFQSTAIGQLSSIYSILLLV